MSIPIDQLIPHRAPMQWVDSLTGCTETTGCAIARFDAGHFAVVDGAVLESALVECVAQTVAAAQGARARGTPSNAPAPPGMLVAISNFRIQSAPPIGKALQIEVRELRRFGAMLQVAGTVSCDGTVIASGDLSLYA